MSRWNPAAHPRWPHNGRFRPKFSQSIRISPLSASYNAGVRFPVVPGRVNVYVGGIARIENAAAHRVLKKAGDRITDKLLGKKLSKGRLGSAIKGRPVSFGGATVTRSRIVNNPTVRIKSGSAVSTRGIRSSGPTYTTAGGRVRKPRVRKPQRRAIRR